MNKYEARKYNQDYTGYQLAYLENDFIYFQKEVNRKFYLIKLIASDLLDGSYELMFEHNISR